MIKRQRSRNSIRTSSRNRRTLKTITGTSTFFSSREQRRKPPGQVRYAVVGLGHISQVAVLPAFKHASRNSKLVALFSDDPVKRRELGRKYNISTVGSYDDYDRCLQRGEIDAVYIAEPNSLHCEFTVRAARAGVHVLCEKPLAVTEKECRKMIDVCRKARVRLMTAYRLHFERANLEAVKIAQSGKLGEIRYFNSIFSMQAQAPNIRLQNKMGGGPLYDLGVYCINAARYLFRDEPTEVLAMTATGSDKRFREVEEMAGAVLRFSGERLATFICSFGAADAATCEIVGTRGLLRMNNAYEYVMPIEMQLNIGGKEQSREFSRRDQFAPELIYFSDCILKNKVPEPSGEEGLNDVRIIQAIHRSAQSSKPVRLPALKKKSRPSLKQEIKRPPVRKPEIIHSKSPSGS
jgi:Predicted dehydrogenases and related proteins